MSSATRATDGGAAPGTADDPADETADDTAGDPADETADDPADDGQDPGPAPVGTWQVATVVAVRRETASIRTLRLLLARPRRRLAGQHYVVRLTAPDGYTATRSYSVGNAPDEPEIELTVERLDDGEVSGYLHDDVVVGDEIEVRGPVGRWFTWRGDGQALLVGGGSGLVPLMAMLRLARHLGREDLLRLVVSGRSLDDLPYAEEVQGQTTTVVLTRSAPRGWSRPAARLRAADLPAPVSPPATVYVCGSSGFCDSATGLLLELGHDVADVRVERFGATG